VNRTPELELVPEHAIASDHFRPRLARVSGRGAGLCRTTRYDAPKTTSSLTSLTINPAAARSRLGGGGPLFYRVMLDGWTLTEEVANRNRSRVRLSVPRQISLQCHLTRYRKGMWILWNHLVNEVVSRRPALKGELLQRTVWVLRNLEMASAALSQTYYAERERQARHRQSALEIFALESGRWVRRGGRAAASAAPSEPSFSPSRPLQGTYLVRWNPLAAPP
jgi:hypothetical protein